MPPTKPQRRPRVVPFPEGESALSFNERIRETFEKALARVRQAHGGSRWAASIEDAITLWESMQAVAPTSAVEAIERALDATILAEATAPPGHEVAVADGGLMVLWLRAINMADPRVLNRNPRGPAEVARRLAVEWLMPDNEDRRDFETCAALNELAAALIVSEKRRTVRQVIDEARELVAGLEHEVGPLPNTRQVVADMATLFPARPKRQRAPRRAPTPSGPVTTVTSALTRIRDAISEFLGEDVTPVPGPHRVGHIAARRTS